MIKSEKFEEHTSVHMSGELEAICCEVEALLCSFYDACTKHMGKEMADLILVRIGRNAVMSDEERDAEHKRLMEEIGCQDN